MNARVLVQTKPSTTSAPPERSNLLQRKCACGGTPGLTGECEECRKNRETGMLQRKVAQPSTLNHQHPDVPLIVHEVLRSPGQPLDVSTREFMESRFGYNFRDVRIHTDARAAESARGINALAYTVGRDVVFGDSQYMPHTCPGRKLVAHQLAHVIQQGCRQSDDLGHLGISAPSSATEREAEGAVTSVMAGRAANVFRGRELFLARRVPNPFQPGTEEYKEAEKAISESERRQREIKRQEARARAAQGETAWTISGNTATADNAAATLDGLARRVGAKDNDWKCMKPLAMGTLDAANVTESQKENYHQFVQPGDKFDFSNLTSRAGLALNLYLFEDGKPDSEAAKRFYPGSVPTDDPDFAIQKASDYGSAPIHDFLLVGHASGNHMFGISGGGNRFEPSSRSSEEPQVFYDEAKKGHFPRRCRFTRNAVTRLVGCDSEAVGEHFANTYLRAGANVTTTTRGIRTVCSGQPRGTPCEHPNALEFVASPFPGFPVETVDGPFRTVADFQASRFWATVPGSL